MDSGRVLDPRKMNGGMYSHGLASSSMTPSVRRTRLGPLANMSLAATRAIVLPMAAQARQGLGRSVIEWPSLVTPLSLPAQYSISG